MNMTKPFMPKNEKQYMLRLSKLVPFFAKLSSGSKWRNLKLLMTPTTSVATKAIAQFSTNNVFFFILKEVCKRFTTELRLKVPGQKCEKGDAPLISNPNSRDP